MKNKTIEVTKEAFNNIYGNAYLKGKYGEDWVDVVVGDLKREGTIVKFITEKQKEAKAELKGLGKLDL